MSEKQYDEFGNTMPYEENRAGSMNWERIIAHVLQVLIVSSIIGGFWMLQELRVTTATMVVRFEERNKTLEATIDAMSKQIDLLISSINDTYTSSDAKRDLRPIQEDLVDHELRIRELEKLITNRN